MTIHPRYIGCDISNHFIDIHDPVSRSAQRLANTPAAMAAFAAAIAGSGALVVMEASGVYDRTLRTALTAAAVAYVRRSEEHTSELQSLMRISYAVFCLKKKTEERKSGCQEDNVKR